MTRPARFSYWTILLTIVLVGALRLGTPLLAVLFSYLVLTKLSFTRHRWLAVGLYVVVILGISYGFSYFIRKTVKALPNIVHTAIPKVADWAEEHQIELPFTDYESLRNLTVDTIKDQAHYLENAANFARGATRQFIFLIIGCVAAASVFLSRQFDLDQGAHKVKDNLYSICGAEIGLRFQALYNSFATVMGAQMIISGINTVLTSIFVLAVGLPHPLVIVGLTFLCGLLPVIGNLISNTIIVAISFTISPKMALGALIFLVVIHKLEYFLNSKIIGDRIRNPVWLTLLGLIIGEKLMGIPGMILAPVLLHYLKYEASRIPVGSANPPPAPSPPSA